MPPYTPKQGQYLAFIHAYTQVQGQPPAEADLQRYFQVSPPSVHQMILTLAERGLISREPGAARSIRILLPVEQLPPLGAEGAVSATTTGSPSTGADSFEATYPTVTAWVATQGWIEIGQDHYSRSMVRALDEGGMVWEGNTTYDTLDALFADLEMHLKEWIAKEL